MAPNVEAPKANPNINAKGPFQFMNRPMLSQYLESEYSIFGNPMYAAQLGTAPTAMMNGRMMMPGAMGGMYGGWYGADVDKYIDYSKKWTNGSYDVMDNSSDRQTKFAFKQRGNQYTLNTSSEILNQKLKEMARHISNNKMGAATAVFNEVCDEINNEVGIELKTHEERVNAKRSIRAAVAKYYAKVNGNDLAADIEANGDDPFMHGMKKALGFVHHNNYIEETIHYMEGSKMEGKDAQDFKANVGKGVGYVAPTMTGFLVGKRFGTKGAVIGTLAGLVWTGIASLFGSSNKTYEEINAF